MRKKNRKRVLKYFSVFMALNILFEVISPTLAYGLTNGALQPEFVGFEHANSSEMVDLFTGDFKYNIPLMDIDGYPLNLAYHAGVNMDSEASWVGLGWSLSPGVLNRNVRGLPDDFNGDAMETYTKFKPSISAGVGFQHSHWFGVNCSYENVGVGAKIGASGQVGLTYNSYKGYGLEIDKDRHLSLSNSLGFIDMSRSIGVGMSLSSQDGGTISENYQNGLGVNVGLRGVSVSVDHSFGKGGSINTRTGAMTKTYVTSASLGLSAGGVGVSYSRSSSHSIPTGPVSYSPKAAYDMQNTGFGLSVKAGLWASIKPFLNGVPLPVQVNGGLLIGYKGYYNSSKLIDNTKLISGYGYLYSENASENSLMDYNSFKDGPIMQETPNINFSSHTYDVFSATAQGLGSSFRPFRSDVGVLKDPFSYSKGKNTNTGTELGVGAFVHTLFDYSKLYSFSKSGYYNSPLKSSLDFINKNITTDQNRFFEKYYFKQMGEISARDGSYESAIGGESPVSPNIQSVGDEYIAFNPLSNLPQRSQRDIRNTYIESLTSKQATLFGKEPTYNLYENGTYELDLNTRLVKHDVGQANIDRNSKTVNSYNKDISHHLSEITISNNQGMRYTYGIPVYNLFKEKVMFNASKWKNPSYNSNDWFPPSSFTSNTLAISDAYQFIEYDASTDLTSNLRGRDNFYQIEKTPLYVSSFLLTSIYSPDYVDVTGNGPTYDDLGSFTKFNYCKEDDYGWREPYCFPAAASNLNQDWAGGSLSQSSKHANYEPGLISDEYDDKAFYEWGKRESYYVHSIETKNFVAIFETSERIDGKGVTDQHGTNASPQMLKLDAVKLYSKSAIAANSGVITGLAPIKTIRFEYDYTLCPATFNSEYNSTNNASRGKLTLKKVFISYGASEKSALSPYVFTYSGNNYSYNPRAIDRWGSYKPNTGNYATGNAGTLNNMEFPYAEQNKALADDYASVWNLTEIKTPTGSKIKIEYESDDYSYVQNEQSAQMLKMQNIVENINPASDASQISPNANIKEGNYLIINLENLYERGIPVNTYSTLALANNFAIKNLIKPDKMLYYKAFVKLGGPANSFGLKKNYWEYVSGYGKVEEVGLFNSTTNGNTYSATLDNQTQSFYKYAYVKLKKEIAYDSKPVFPITIAGWDYMRNFLPGIAYPGSEPATMGNSSNKPLKMFKTLKAGLGVAKEDMINGVAGKPNKRFYDNHYCNEVDYAKSLVRCYVPLKTKLGGGYRVKKIITDDAWNSMASGESKTTYGQSFEYTIKEGKFKISSGVALYEPLIGGDEISLRQPIEFEIKKMFAPNDHLYHETPYAEMLYPSPLVGYSKVTVRQLPDPESENGPEVCKIGKTEYEFYTAKDFPIIYQTSGLSKQMKESPIIEDFVIITKTYKRFAASQGHVIKMNDMHGKLKAILTYAEDSELSPISGTRYFYKHYGSNNGSKQLITNALSINEKNQISNVVMSKDIDISVDEKNSETNSITMGQSLMVDVGMLLLIVTTPAPPVVIPAPGMPIINKSDIYSEHKFGVNTSSITKIVQQYGILDKVEVFDNKSKTLTENLLWDKNTGDVVLSRETNNLDQSVYSFNYPAYWSYPQMGHEFKRDNIELLCPSSASTTIWNATTGELFSTSVSNPLLIEHGDELRVFATNTLGIPTSTLSTNGDYRFWASLNSVNSSYSIGSLLIVDKNGTVVNNTNYGTSANNNYLIKVVKPVSNNNMVQSAGFVTSRLTPVVGSSISITPTLNIIDAGVQEFCSGNTMYLNPSLTQHSLTNTAPNYTSQVINPITTGFYGVFRPSSSYKYNVNRVYSNTQPNISSDGFYEDFSAFWSYNSFFKKWVPVADNHWVKLNNNKYYSPHGELLETENIYLISSASRNGFNHTLPIFNATNAKGDEVGFDSFEEYTVYPSLSTNTTNVYNNDYLGIYNHLTTAANSPTLNSSGAHSGRYSLGFATTKTLSIQCDYSKYHTIPEYNSDEYNNCVSYILNYNKLNLRNKKYIISFWVKGTAQSNNYASLVNFNVKETHCVNSVVTTTTNAATLVNKSPIIDGWQKLDYEVNITYSIPQPPSVHQYSTYDFVIYSGATTGFYLDDLRIQPFNSSMTCFVYDPIYLRLCAQLDDNNYAVFSEYDSEGMLVRKKKETQKGIFTIQESRRGIVKQ